MISLDFRGSYTEQAFCLIIAQALKLPAAADIHAALRQLIGFSLAEVQITWHDFHGTQVGPLGADGMGEQLRAAAQKNARLRLVFYDEERGGQ